MSCANLLCEEPPTTRLRYQAPAGQRFEYLLCPFHADHAHIWLAARPHLAATAVAEQLTAQADQPALF